MKDTSTDSAQEMTLEVVDKTMIIKTGDEIVLDEPLENILGASFVDGNENIFFRNGRVITMTPTETEGTHTLAEFTEYFNSLLPNIEGSTEILETFAGVPTSDGEGVEFYMLENGVLAKSVGDDGRIYPISVSNIITKIVVNGSTITLADRTCGNDIIVDLTSPEDVDRFIDGVVLFSETAPEVTYGD